MIRFPNRYHASDTPGAGRFDVEPCANETERSPRAPRESERKYREPANRCAAKPHERFDFSTILQVLG